MKRFRVGKQIFLHLLFAAMLVAGESFAVESPQVDLSVKTHKTPRTRTWSYEHKDDQAKGELTDKGVEFGSSTDKDTSVTSGSYTLAITVANRGGQAGSCQLEWYFIADKISGGDGKYKKALDVVGRGQKNITLGAGAVVEETATRDFAFKEDITTGIYNVEIDPTTGKFPDWKPQGGTDPWDYESKSGERYAGYVVLITANGQMIAKDSNSSIFLKDKWINKCRTWRPKDKDYKPTWRDSYNQWW